MNEIIEFATNHAILVTAFVVVAALLIVDVAQGFAGGGVSPQQAVELLNREAAVTVDVRPEAEFASGHVINALHIPLAELQPRAAELQKFRDKPIVVCCASGTIGARAVKTLKRDGFLRACHLKGGIAAWRGDNLPLTQGK